MSDPRHEQLLIRSRRLFVAAFALVLLALLAVVTTATLHMRHGIREQIAARDGEVLHALASLYYAEDIEQGLAGDMSDPASQLSIVLRASEMRGVLGVRVFGAAGEFLASFPPDVTESALDQAHLVKLRELRPSAAFHPAMPNDRLFYTTVQGTNAQRLAILEVNVPLHVEGGKLDGIAQFLLEGQSISREYLLLDRRLTLEAAAVLLACAMFLGLPVGWLFRRLRRAHELVDQRTRDLVRANRDLALSAKTSALGAVTAHLFHGLKNPLAGLEDFITSQTPSGNGADSEWHDAIVSTQRVQGMIRQVLDVIREEQSGAAYEITVPELLGLLRPRIEPLAARRGVSFTTDVQTEALLGNREANLVLLILLNLIENAIHASPSGCTVVLSISGLPAGLAFRVRDQGPGFPADVPLFMPCHSKREGGSGIGLALCKQLAQHLGAELSLSQSSSSGCEFTLLLSGRAGAGTPCEARSERDRAPAAPPRSLQDQSRLA